MPMDRFLIAPLNTGFQTDLKAWLIMDDSWARLENAYVFRGRVRKRFGEELMGTGAPSLALEQLFSRLRIQVGTIGAPTSPVPGGIFKIGQMFSAGTQIFTVWQLGAPAAMLATGPGTGTYNTTTGAFVLAGTGLPNGTPIFFYPAEPVMGLTQYEIGAINNFPTYGFDTQFAYVFTGGAWQRSGTVVWHDPSGNKANYFWSTNWSGFSQNLAAYNRALFTTNFQVTNPNGAPTGTDDPIYWFDGTTWTAFTPYFAPAGGAPGTGPFVQTSRLIVGFKNRLVLLNTIETNAAGNANINYQFRARYSWNGSPFATNAWYEPNQTDNTPLKAGGAGYVDASTEEQIISAEFIKDRLIVYFERSTWELAYTGNEVEPFVWQKINTELGTEATFSVVPFDKEILSIGNTGVHACNGANVARIDTKIPDYIFRIVDKATGTQRVAGIRDYFTEMVYWTFPSVEQNPAETFQTKVLAYNYQNGSWAVFDDCINTWGYFEQQGVGTTWATSLLTWEESDEVWASGTTQPNFRQVIAGNQEGYTFIVNPDISRNAPAMQLTNIVASGSGFNLTIVDHTLTTFSFSPTESSGDFICIENAQGVTGLNDKIYPCFFVDKDTVYITANFTGTYTGGGTVTRISEINMLSKQWNPYVGQGQDFYLARIDFLVDKTDVGQVTVDYFPSSTEVSMVNDGLVNGSLMGNNVLETSPYDPALYPLEQYQERLWHPLYFQTTGECVQIQIALKFDQVTSTEIAWEDFQLHALVLHTEKTSMRLQ
jgi:hypothetical protein